MSKIFKAVCVSAFAVFLGACSALTSDKTELANELKGLASMCPADLMPAKTVEYFDQIGMCDRSEVQCVSRCSKDDANACFALAHVIEQKSGPYEQSKVFYQQACKLGLTIGCTNAAAGMLEIEESRDGTCLLKSFEGGCSKEDPWACTMQVILLSDKRHVDMVERDFDAALKAIKKSCKFGPDNPACTGSKEMKTMILNAMKK